MRKITKRAAIVTATFGLVAAGSGIAYAAWTADGAGSARAGASRLIALHGAAEAVTGLSPGGSVTATVPVQNDNAYNVNLTSVTRGDNVISNRNGCAGELVTVTPITYLPATVAKNDTGSVDVSITLSADAPNACQGAAFAIPLKLGTSVGTGAS